MKVAIHQPNFFPWLGFFYKISRCDHFVFLDDVKLPGGSSWVNRVKVLNGNSSKWITGEIDSSTRKNYQINQVRYREGKWKDDIWNLIVSNYRRSDCWKEGSILFEPLVLNPKLGVADYNMEAILTISKSLSITRPFFDVSSRFNVRSSGTERLIDLVTAVNGDTYVSGDGADGYQENDLFRKRGITLSQTSFLHPRYRQKSDDFIGGLSAIDAIFNVGLEKTTKLLGIDAE